MANFAEIEYNLKADLRRENMNLKDKLKLAKYHLGIMLDILDEHEKQWNLDERIVKVLTCWHWRDLFREERNGNSISSNLSKNLAW